jgi:outer membrane protein
MRPSLRPLTFALMLVGIAGPAGATDLLDAYEMARQGDPQLAAAESSRDAVGENVAQSRARLLPQISGSATLSETNVKAIEGDSSRGRGYGLQLDQSIYDHANWTGLAASRLRSDGADFDYKAAADDLVVRTAEAYFNVLTAIETLASSRAEERSVKRQLDQAEKRLEVGLAPITDVHEARARYDTARANAIAAGTALEDSREALAEITGRRLDNLEGLAADYVPKNTDTRGAEEWVAIALEQNPTLLSRELSLAAAEKDIGTARAAHYPTLSGGISTDHSSGWNNFGSPGSRVADTTVGVSLNVPIYSGGATQSRVRQFVDYRDIAADQLEQQRRLVVRTTRNAQRSLAAGDAEVEARRLSVVSAQAAVEASEAGLEVGTRTIVDVLITQQALYNAQREYARARHAFLVNTLRLKQAAGTITVADLEEVNRVLVADAEAALEEPPLVD